MLLKWSILISNYFLAIIITLLNYFLTVDFKCLTITWGRWQIASPTFRRGHKLFRSQTTGAHKKSQTWYLQRSSAFFNRKWHFFDGLITSFPQNFKTLNNLLNISSITSTIFYMLSLRLTRKFSIVFIRFSILLNKECI